jgi:tetratricopeptide (TPR) repeat protein
MLAARNNAANVYLLLGRFDEVVERLKDLLDWERATKSVFSEQFGLLMLADALCELGRYEEAQRAANELQRVSQLTNSPLGELNGKIQAARAAALAKTPGAIEALERLIETVDAEGASYEKAEIRLYFADVVAASKPDVAAAYCRDARSAPETEDAGRLRRLVEKIEQKLSAGPVRFGPRGELIIDPSRGWPEYDFTVETVKRFLIFGAARESGNNRSEAARKLGLSRSRLHDIWRQLHGEPVRPRRDGADTPHSDEAASRQ